MKNMKKGDVCIVRLSGGVGREQEGERPAIFFADTKTSIAVVIPITSNLEAARFLFTSVLLSDKHNNLDVSSVALVFHIRSIDLHRITKKIGRLAGNDLKKLDEVVKKMLKF
jgi:mRNA-degrading endonuclease toxin of MazEF toxin-antitoxin module